MSYKSRYKWIKQLPYCCVPVCFQMIFIKNGLKSFSQQEIGSYLGLRVPSHKAELFTNPVIGNPDSGYGVMVDTAEFRPNEALKKLGVDLQIRFETIDLFHSHIDLSDTLEQYENVDKDVILCMKWSEITNSPVDGHGHVCVFDRIIDGKIYFVDSHENEKLRVVTVEKMYNAMVHRGGDKRAGLWVFEGV